jgi:hypothetical protein
MIPISLCVKTYQRPYKLSIITEEAAAIPGGGFLWFGNSPAGHLRFLSKVCAISR